MKSKTYFDDFSSFRLNETYRFSSSDVNYINRLKEELFSVLRNRKFNGWYVDNYHFNQIGSFLFVKDDSRFGIFITPFYQLSNNSLDVEIAYEGYSFGQEHSIKDLSSYLNKNINHDVNVLFDMIVEKLEEVSKEKTLFGSVLNSDEIMASQGSLLRASMYENDPDLILGCIKYFPEIKNSITINKDFVSKLIKSELNMDPADFFQMNTEKWEEIFSFLCGNEEAERYFEKIKKIKHGKDMFGV